MQKHNNSMIFDFSLCLVNNIAKCPTNHTSLFACGSSIAPVLPLSFSAQAMQDRSVFRSVYFPLFAKDYFHACLVRELYQII